MLLSLLRVFVPQIFIAVFDSTIRELGEAVLKVRAMCGQTGWRVSSADLLFSHPVKCGAFCSHLSESLSELTPHLYQVGWAFLNIVSKFTFIFYIQRIKDCHCATPWCVSRRPRTRRSTGQLLQSPESEARVRRSADCWTKRRQWYPLRQPLDVFFSQKSDGMNHDEPQNHQWICFPSVCQMWCSCTLLGELVPAREVV